ncbi:MAG: hypothetical protein OXH79_03960 [Boseongicola sp.]|nr:hypothetical protein [Boseongicola sp.]
MGPAAEEFRTALRARLQRATEAGEMSLEVRSGDLHREVGDYPGPDHRMPVCCQVMRGEMTKADELVTAPPKGNGASVVIRYRLPRRG